MTFVLDSFSRQILIFFLTLKINNFLKICCLMCVPNYFILDAASVRVRRADETVSNTLT